MIILSTDNKVSKWLALKYFKKWAEVRGSSFPLQCISNVVQNSWQHVSVFLTEGTYCLFGKKIKSEALTAGKPIKIPLTTTRVQNCDSGIPKKQSFSHSLPPTPKLLAKKYTINSVKERQLYDLKVSQQLGGLRPSQLNPLYNALNVNGKIPIPTSQECG